jgi:Tfp pilus assembly protein PilO
MDLKDPKIQKILLAGLGALLLIYFWHSKVYVPNNEKLDVRRSNYEQLMANLKTIELKAKSLEGLRKEYEKLYARYETVEQLLPDEEQVPEFLMQLHKAALTSQSVIAEVQPQTPTGESFYNVSQYSVKFKGTYHELGRFLASVANFPFITNVSELGMEGLPANQMNQLVSDNSTGEQDKQTLETNFFLSTYYVKEEEKLRGVEFAQQEGGN